MDGEPPEVRTSSARVLWWLNPAGAVAAVLVPSLFLAATTSDQSFRKNWRTPKTLDGSTLQLLVAGGLVLVIGALLPLAVRRPVVVDAWPALDVYDRVLLRRAGTVLYRVTLVGYSLYLLAGVRNGLRPGDFVHVFVTQNNEGNELKKALVPIAGVTTLTQVGIAYVVVGSLLLVYGRHSQTEHRLMIVGALAASRAFFVSERLAVTELVVPMASIIALGIVHSSRVRVRLMARLAPLFLLPILILGFGIFEYSRSWAFYSTHSDQSFTSFTINRFAGYYATGYNNGAIQLKYGRYYGRIPYGSLEGVWTGPFIEQAHIYERFSGADEVESYQALLQQYGNPEFSNPSGLVTPFVDFGDFGGLAYLFGVGLLVGFAYIDFCRAKLWAMLTYPVIMTGLLELPRYLYWAQGRAFVAFLALALVVRYVRSGRARSTKMQPSRYASV